jgi:hypothetical protein
VVLLVVVAMVVLRRVVAVVFRAFFLPVLPPNHRHNQVVIITGNRVWVKIRISPRQSVDDDFKPSRSFSATDRFEFDVTYTLGVPPPAAAMMDPL